MTNLLLHFSKSEIDDLLVLERGEGPWFGVVREGVVPDLVSLAGHLEAQLGELRALPIVGDTRGAGFFWAVELVKDEANTRFEPAEVVFEPVAA